MLRPRFLTGLLLLLAMVAPISQAQLGKPVIIPAGSDADQFMKSINDESDPAKKLALIDDFAKNNGTGQFATLVDEQYVNYYISAKNYPKAFEYGDKLYALDPENYNNAVNMVRASNEAGDLDRLFTWGERSQSIITNYKSAAPPADGAEAWQATRAQRLDSLKEDQVYVEASMLNGAYHVMGPDKRAVYLQRFAKTFPDSPSAEQALTMSAFDYQQSQNRPKMLETANAILAKDPDNIGVLLLLADDYSEKPDQLGKAETYASKAVSLCDAAKKPANFTDDQWQGQLTLQKGLALSALGQVHLEKKDNASAVKSLTAAAPLLKSNAAAYGRNQYRLGFAYLNLKKNADAKQAFTDCVSVDSPYKAQAEDKLRALNAVPTHKKAG